MAVEETKHDLFLKRAQVTVAILAGIATLIIGVYNVKKTVFSGPAGPGGIQAVIQNEEARPVAGAYTELLNSANVLVTASNTDASGTFSKEGFDAGNYVLKVSARGYEPQIVTVQVASKKTAHVEIMLRSISGPAQSKPDTIRSAVEEAGASWIKRLASGSTAADEKK